MGEFAQKLFQILSRNAAVKDFRKPDVKFGSNGFDRAMAFHKLIDQRSREQVVFEFIPENPFDLGSRGLFRHSFFDLTQERLHGEVFPVALGKN